MNTSNLVVIPTVGLGTRLGDLTKNLNKSLIPLKNQPIITHIINRFSSETKFIIILGNFAEQVRTYLSIAHKDRHFIFHIVDDYLSNKSGPGYSLLSCAHLIDQPFWYIPCDTYFDETLPQLADDGIFVKKVPGDLSSEYTMFDLDHDNRIKDIKFKQKTLDSYTAFTGVMYIKNHKVFFDRIIDTEVISGIQIGHQAYSLDSWEDVGNKENYNRLINHTFDFSKTNEQTYQVGSQIIKWFADNTTAEIMYTKCQYNPNVMPLGCAYDNNFFYYQKEQGSVFYDDYNIIKFNHLITWLDFRLWQNRYVDISGNCLEFYKTKTNKRISLLLEKYPEVDKVKKVNNTTVKNWSYYYDLIDWDLLIGINHPSFIHGDLQFDNIIVGNYNKFTLIDWRPDFAGLVDAGDLYYDFAKLLGGFILNYKEIKKGNFSYKENTENVQITFPSIINHKSYNKLLEKFALDKGLNYEKIVLLVPIIYWNMSPLHAYPFDKLLWYLGILLFEEIFSRKITNTNLLLV